MSSLDPKQPICLKKYFLRKTINMTFMYLLPLSSSKIFKTLLGWIQSSEDVSFLQPKQLIGSSRSFFKININMFLIYCPPSLCIIQIISLQWLSRILKICKISPLLELLLPLSEPVHRALCRAQKRKLVEELIFCYNLRLHLQQFCINRSLHKLSSSRIHKTKIIIHSLISFSLKVHCLLKGCSLFLIRI